MQATDSKNRQSSGDDLRALVDQEGRVILPPELTARYGLQPGAQIPVDEGVDSLRLRLPVTRLVKSVGRIPLKEQIKRWLLESIEAERNGGNKK